MNHFATLPGVLCCRADTITVNAITLVGGLAADAIAEESAYRLRGCRSDLQARVVRDLWPIVKQELDRAVAIGIIPSWSLHSELPTRVCP